DTQYVTAQKQVAIFMQLMVYGMGNREAQECFQRSGDTISKVFHWILSLTSSGPFYTKFVHFLDDILPDMNHVIANDSCFAPFVNCHSAIDGSLEDAF
ncbi:hypothetical protein F5880DRAFT_1441515, partial [Lentinula raphanica]